MYKIKDYMGTGMVDIEMDDINKAKVLCDQIFEATGKSVYVLDTDLIGMGGYVYTKLIPKDQFEFDMKDSKKRENTLMETAMRIMDLMCDMHYAHRLHPDKLDEMSFNEKLQMFCDWAREYEYTYYGTKKYEDEWLEHTEKVFTEKLILEFGNVDEILFGDRKDN